MDTAYFPQSMNYGEKEEQMGKKGQYILKESTKEIKEINKTNKNEIKKD